MYYNTCEFQVSESFILGMPAGNMLILEQKALGWTMTEKDVKIQEGKELEYQFFDRL